LVGQFLAWQQLNQEGVYAASNAASSFFFILTAAHAVHLFGVLVSLSWAAVAGFAMSLQSRQIATDITAWYWHAMGLLWVYILGLLYWLR
jgi:cytochrome c oxidase subunit 3